MTSAASTTVKIVVSMVVVAALVATTFNSKTSTGLKGARKLQGFGGVSNALADTTGQASSINYLVGQMSAKTDPTLGVTGNGVSAGTSFGSSNTFSPGAGTSQATGAANGFGNSTSTQVGGTTAQTNGAIAPEINFGNGFGEFDASGGGASSFGSSLFLQGTEGTPGTEATAATQGSKNGGGTAATAATPGVAGTPDIFVGALQTGGNAGGFGFTLGGGIGNVSGDKGYSDAYGTAEASGFGSSVGTNAAGTGGGSGGGTSDGFGGGGASPSMTGTTPENGITAFNGTGGGLASGGAGASFGFNPEIVSQVTLGNFGIRTP